MKRILIVAHHPNKQEILDCCIAAGGKGSRFRSDKPADAVLGGGVRILRRRTRAELAA